jgi:hypothetical protein
MRLSVFSSWEVSHRTGAYMLWAGAIVVDIFMLLAVVSLIT